jgi:hypothetical protein
MMLTEIFYAVPEFFIAGGSVFIILFSIGLSLIKDKRKGI